MGSKKLFSKLMGFMKPIKYIAEPKRRMLNVVIRFSVDPNLEIGATSSMQIKVEFK